MALSVVHVAGSLSPCPRFSAPSGAPGPRYASPRQLCLPCRPRLCRVACTANARRWERASSAVNAQAAATCIAAALASAGVLLPLGSPAVAAAATNHEAAVEEAQAQRAAPSYLALGSPTQAPALGLLAQDLDAALSPEERARQLIQELRRKKEEEAAARAAAAAAAEEALRAEAAKQAAAAAAAQASSRKAPSPVQQVQGEQKQGAPAPTKTSSRRAGGMPLAASQFGLLAVYSGVGAAAFLIPEKQWRVVNQQLEVAGEKLIPVLDEAWEKSKPSVEKAQVRGQELLVQAQPYVVKAVEAARPVIAKAVEQAKPLLAQATEKVSSSVNNVLNKKDEKVDAKL